MIGSIKQLKASYELLKEGNALLEEQNIDIKDFDDQFLIESRDIKWSFPITARAIKKGQDKCIMFLPQGKQVLCGVKGTYVNREECKKLKIPVVPFPIGGGACITDKDDILILLVYKAKKQANWVGHIQERVMDFLVKKKINACIKGNDIEVDGKKISGSSITQRMGTNLEAIFFASNNMQELVTKISDRDGSRKTSGLKDFDVDIKQFIEFLKKDVIDYFGVFRKEIGGLR